MCRLQIIILPTTIDQLLIQGPVSHGVIIDVLSKLPSHFLESGNVCYKTSTTHPIMIGLEIPGNLAMVIEILISDYTKYLILYPAVVHPLETNLQVHKYRI